MHIHIQWSSPLKYSEALKLNDEFIDYGVYQVYGTHPLYGSDVLIYIGKADKQTFGKRLSQEGWGTYNQDAARVLVSVGRLSGYKETPPNDEWSRQISDVERLLIYSHWPAGNSSGLNVQFGKEHHDVHVFNWGEYRDLLPEVSGARYSDRYQSQEGYVYYGESRRHS
ncbi:MAG TPA: hypothetical protein VGK09_00575 [Rhodocyclaceae bacterium]